MNTEKLQKRDSSLDIVRIVAVFTVLSVHFFLHNGFYSQPVNNWPMYIMTGMRTLFSICVPMFMMLTGYLMSHKKLSKSYYKGIAKTLVVFVLITIVCMVYKAVHNHEVYRWQDFIFDTNENFLLRSTTSEVTAGGTVSSTSKAESLFAI